MPGVPLLPAGCARRTDERGSLAPLMPVVAMALLMLAGLGIDGSRQLNARGQAVAFAEEAARAGATQVDPNSTSVEVDEAKARAAVSKYCARVLSLGQVTQCHLVAIRPISSTDRRRNIVVTERSVGVFLDLVAMNLAGGRGLPEALLAAANVGDHWSMIRIRQALANARLYGTTPWHALGELGREIGVEQFEELSGALVLAADDGAKIRTSLSARAATLRRRELTQAEGEEGEKSQSMLVAQMLISTAFLIFLGYPAVAQLLRA